MNESEISRLIEMAWDDRISFEDIRLQFGLTNGEIIKLMRKNLKISSFKMWRKRTAGRLTKHKVKNKLKSNFKY